PRRAEDRRPGRVGRTLNVDPVHVEQRGPDGEPSANGEQDDDGNADEDPKAAPPGSSLDLDPTSTDPRIHGKSDRQGASLGHIKLYLRVTDRGIRPGGPRVGAGFLSGRAPAGGRTR